MALALAKLVTQLPRICDEPIPWIGDQAFFLFDPYFVVEVTITAVDLVLFDPYGNCPTRWLYISPDFADGYDGTLPNEHGVNEKINTTNIRKYAIASWFVDIDLPVGHSICSDADGLFWSLSEAMKCVRLRGAKKRHKRQALGEYVRRRKTFIASTQGKLVDSILWPSYTTRRKIYNRKR